MACLLVIWLHSRAGVSRAVTNKVLRAIQVIISATLYLVGIALMSSGFAVKLSNVKLPHDVRTAYQLHCPEPEIIRTACCPQCFSLFPHPIPWKCQWKESPRSHACNTNLWKIQNTRNGPKWVPRQLYSTQSFDSWLQFFLSRQIIEDSLHKAYHHRINHPPAVFGANINDIQGSPAWNDILGFFQSPYHLLFGIYVDWYNPYTNKIAGKLLKRNYTLIQLIILHIGKKVSCGAILLYCWNLPFNLRYQPENIFIVGLTPPPHLPDPTTISHLLDPVITSVVKYGVAPGQDVPTSRHPNGVPVQAKIAPVIADLEGSRKVSGFLAHGATMFCSFCLCTKDQLEDLNMQSWQLRNGVQVRAQAEAWLNQTTKAGRNALAKSNGVRWTPLHRLPYWDPVKHVILGFMHNWLEGILQHHLRSLWRIGQDEDESQKIKEIELDEQLTEEDVSDSTEELEGLFQETAEYETANIMAMQHTPPPMSPSPSSSFTAGSSMSESSSTPTATQIHSVPYDLNSDDEEDSNDSDYIPADTVPFSFTPTELQAIQDCIRDITLPTWIQRPPVNLGEPSHGKLKAREYLTLFTCIFPLIIPEFWYIVAATDFHRQHFQCFYNLVAATNIIAAFKTSNADADAHTQHYIQYRSAIQTLFPYRPSKPNHHYAMHNGSLLKYWGPLASLSEFSGERINGMLQNINTNHRLHMFNYTHSKLVANINCRRFGFNNAPPDES